MEPPTGNQPVPEVIATARGALYLIDSKLLGALINPVAVLRVEVTNQYAHARIIGDIIGPPDHADSGLDLLTSLRIDYWLTVRIERAEGSIGIVHLLSLRRRAICAELLVK